MKNKLLIIGLLLSFSANAAYEMHCGEIKRTRTWINGSDTYGVWVEYKSNPSSCAGGFYLPQTGNNRDHIYSFLLSAKARDATICIQTPLTNKIGNRCRINYVMDQ